MSTFHCWSGDFTLETRFYLSLQFGSYSLCSSENNAFSVMCDVCRKPVKRVFWAQIPRDICTRFERYLYLTESSWILILYIYLLVSNPNPSSVTSRCILGLPGCQVGMIANVVCTIMFYTFLFSVNRNQFLRGNWKRTANTRTFHSSSGWNWFFPCWCDWCNEDWFQLRILIGRPLSPRVNLFSSGDWNNV